MSLSPEELRYLTDLARKLRRDHQPLSLEIVMMLHYKKPCRRMTPTKFGSGFERGSVVVTREEVLVFCNTLDFHLADPQSSFSIKHVKVMAEDGINFMTSDCFRSGTTLIQSCGTQKVMITHVITPHEYTIFQRQPQKYNLYRWGKIGDRRKNEMPYPYDEAIEFTRPTYTTAEKRGRVITCKEEFFVRGSLKHPRKKPSKKREVTFV